jgi:peptidoglycan/xylan/chitin deacetylase (PgdA/CDA1 family)
MPWKQRYTISDETSLGDDDVRWPAGGRCAVHIVVDVSVALGREGISAKDLAGNAAQFATTQGLDLLLALLARHRLRATFAVPAVMAMAYPQRIRAILAGEHEVAAGGLRHEDVSTLDRDEERRRLALTGEILADVAGRRPEGWYSLPRQSDAFAGGSISANTMDLLLEAGYAYMGNSLADDIPHYWVTDFARRRAILCLPYYYHFDDQFFCMFPPQGTGLENSDMLLRNWRGELDAQYRRGRFFTMTVHPQHSGWCNRLALLEEFLAYLTRLPDLWNPTGAECARYWKEAYPERVALRLEPSIWKDYPGSLS